MLGHGREHGGKDLGAARIEEQGVPVADDQVFIGVDDRVLLLGIARERDPLVVAVVEQDLSDQGGDLLSVTRFLGSESGFDDVLHVAGHRIGRLAQVRQ
ncbi:hypothetical protein D3C87_1481610 [compost metagenome]